MERCERKENLSGFKITDQTIFQDNILQTFKNISVTTVGTACFYKFNIKTVPRKGFNMYHVRRLTRSNLLSQNKGLVGKVIKRAFILL